MTTKTTKTTKIAQSALPKFDAKRRVALGAKKRTSDREGPKDTLYALVPRKGSVTVGALVERATKEGLDAERVKRWIPTWAVKHYIELR